MDDICPNDRALATSAWALKFPTATVLHLTAATSDHAPILLKIQDGETRPTAKPPFRYEVMWETHETWQDTFSQCWSEGQPIVSLEELQVKLRGISDSLGNWNRNTFGSVRKEIKNLLAELERLRGDPRRIGPSHAELKINEKLVEFYHRETKTQKFFI